MELGGDSWSWIEVEGAGWRWVHDLAIPIVYKQLHIWFN